MPPWPKRTVDLLILGIWVAALTMVGVVIADARSDRAPASATAPSTVEAQSPTTTSPQSEIDPNASTGSTTDGSTTVDPAATGPATGASATTTTLPPLLVAAGGDVMGDRQVAAFIDEHGGEAVFADVAPYLSDAHVTFVNLESPLSDQGSRETGKSVTFRGKTALVDGIASAGVDVVSLANNHALDWGAAALLDTIERLSSAGVAVAGAGPDSAAARAPAVLETQAGTVAVLAFADIVPAGFSAGTDRAGVNSAKTDRQRLLDDIAAAADRADYVLVSFHWGLEYDGYAGEAQRTLAHQAVDAGADLVIGHHPHVLQGLEIYKNKLIAYSLGDFVFDHYSRATGEAVILRVMMSPDGPPALTVIPVYLEDPHGIPRPVHGQEAAAILDRLAGFSERLGLTLTRGGDMAGYAPR